jgi:hypothetical protein
MIKLTFCLRRLPSLSREEFQRIWRDDHAPLVKAAAEHLGIKRYVQCHTDDYPAIMAGAAARGIAHGEGEDFDGVAELWFDDDFGESLSDPQTPGAVHPDGLASSHKLGRPVGLADRWSRSETVPDRQQAAKHAKILLKDEARFIDFTRSRMFATQENVVIG